MRTREPRPAPLILRDLQGSTILSVTGSNQGEPFRETLLLDFGHDHTIAPPDPIASVELEPAEETALRALLNTRFRRCLRNAAEHRGEGRTFIVTDFDRIEGGMHSDAGVALREAESLSVRHPGNAIHVLGTTAIAVSGELRTLYDLEPTQAAKDMLWGLLEAHRARLFESASRNLLHGYRYGDGGETRISLKNVEARRLLGDAPTLETSEAPEIVRTAYHAGAKAMRERVLGILKERQDYFQKTATNRSGSMNRNWTREDTVRSYRATADEVREIPPIVMPAERPAEPPTPPDAETPTRAVLAADVEELASQLRTLVAYARWQIAEGDGHHPTLRSAVASAEQALFARGLDADSRMAELVARLKATAGDAGAR